MDELVKVVEQGMAELGIPGAAVAVLDGGRDVRVVCRGVTSLTDPLPVDERTIFQIGSISKTFVGTAAMVLVDRGVLALDEPVRTYVPDLRLSSEELTAGLTMRHVLTHTTGWVGDYFGNTGEGDDALARFVAKLAKAPQLTPLGSTYSYNNSAFNLGAHVIAAVTGSPFEEAMAELVIRPLGLRDTFYSGQDAVTRRVAIGHRGGAAQRWTRARAHHGNGGVLSCVADLVQYAAFHMGDGSPLMSRATLDLMQAPQRPAGSLCDEVGIVWFLDRYAGDRMVHHGGTTNGYMSDLRMVRARDIAWVMLTNSDHNHQLDRLIREHLLGPDDALVPFVPSSGLVEFTGRYEAVLADLTVSLDEPGADLVVRVATPERAKWNRDDESEQPVPTRLAFRDADRVVALDPPFTGWRGEFLRGPNDTVEWFRWDGRIARRTDA